MTDALPYLTYLLAHDPAVHGPFNRARTAALVRAAVVVELALRGQLAEADGVVRPTGAPADRDPVLAAARPRCDAQPAGWAQLLRRDRAQTLRAVEDRLAATGLLTVEERQTLVVPTRWVTLTTPEAADAVRRRVAALLAAPGPARRVPPDDAALAALAAAAGLPPAHRGHPRGAAMTRRLADVAPGLAQAIRNLPADLAQSTRLLGEPHHEGPGGPPAAVPPS
ncbi:GPP34 family phosphoprotein [Kitasatospora acidiphila]|uniref:GPP34 family phosphoprotein n=1 Tax=Kitasatospora acidiphila TaxID=2567942 RepID=UPI003C71113B